MTALIAWPSFHPRWKQRSTIRWQHRLKREHPTCTERRKRSSKSADGKVATVATRPGAFSFQLSQLWKHNSLCLWLPRIGRLTTQNPRFGILRSVLTTGAWQGWHRWTDSPQRLQVGQWRISDIAPGLSRPTSVRVSREGPAHPTSAMAAFTGDQDARETPGQVTMSVIAILQTVMRPDQLCSVLVTCLIIGPRRRGKFPIPGATVPNCTETT